MPDHVLGDPACQARTARGTPVWLPSPPRAWPVPSYASTRVSRPGPRVVRGGRRGRAALPRARRPGGRDRRRQRGADVLPARRLRPRLPPRGDRGVARGQRARRRAAARVAARRRRALHLVGPVQGPVHRARARRVRALARRGRARRDRAVPQPAARLTGCTTCAGSSARSAARSGSTPTRRARGLRELRRRAVVRRRQRGADPDRVRGRRRVLPRGCRRSTPATIRTASAISCSACSRRGSAASTCSWRSSATATTARRSTGPASSSPTRRGSDRSLDRARRARLAGAAPPGRDRGGRAPGRRAVRSGELRARSDDAGLRRAARPRPRRRGRARRRSGGGGPAPLAARDRPRARPRARALRDRRRVAPARTSSRATAR